MTASVETPKLGPGQGIDAILGEVAPAVTRKLYHCGITGKHPPCENITLRHLSAPLTNRFYKDDDDQEGMAVPGSLVALSKKEHAEAIAKLDRLIVEWTGTNPPAKPGETRLRGVGPGENYTAARVYDVKQAGLMVNRDNCEPLSRYVYVYPIENAEHRFSPKPSVEEMRAGKTAPVPAPGELDELRQRIAELEAERARLLKEEADYSEEKSKELEGKPLDPAADVQREIDNLHGRRGKKHRR